MNPYDNLPNHHFWNKQVGATAPEQIEYDPQPKLKFDLQEDVFGTAGSCFAQHFARQLVGRGGRYYVAEVKHPLVKSPDHGYGLFSARYGNIYTTRQLHEMLRQALKIEVPVEELSAREDGRVIDMLRPNAVPSGFSSLVEAKWDRLYHLKKVVEVFQYSTVFVFTLGLTEYWENTKGEYAYPLCPGVVAGQFDPEVHRFCNDDYDQVLFHLEEAIKLIRAVNSKVKILLTVSPVMLVATYEGRGAIQSSVASKSILRAVADRCQRKYEYVDYFPSYEIVTGSPARGRYFRQGARDVSPEGVNSVMDCFFRSRMGLQSHYLDTVKTVEPDYARQQTEIESAFQVECDEILLDRK